MTVTAVDAEEPYAFLLRKVAWDVLPCEEAKDYLRVLGLVPASYEGAEVEHQDSHVRMALQEPLRERIAVFSELSAKVLAALALKLTEDPEPGELVELVITQFTQTIQVGASVIIANLLEQGQLQLGPAALSVG